MPIITIKIDAKYRFNQAARYAAATAGLALATYASYNYGIPYVPLVTGTAACFTFVNTARFLEKAIRYKRKGIYREVPFYLK